MLSFCRRPGGTMNRASYRLNAVGRHEDSQQTTRTLRVEARVCQHGERGCKTLHVRRQLQAGIGQDSAARRDPRSRSEVLLQPCARVRSIRRAVFGDALTALHPARRQAQPRRQAQGEALEARGQDPLGRDRAAHRSAADRRRRRRDQRRRRRQLAPAPARNRTGHRRHRRTGGAPAARVGPAAPLAAEAAPATAVRDR